MTKPKPKRAKTFPRDVAERIVDRLFDDMNDRRGFHVDTLDDETRTYFRMDFVRIITEELTRKATL